MSLALPAIQEKNVLENDQKTFRFQAVSWRIEYTTKTIKKPSWFCFAAEKIMADNGYLGAEDTPTRPPLWANHVAFRPLNIFPHCFALILISSLQMVAFSLTLCDISRLAHPKTGFFRAQMWCLNFLNLPFNLQILGRTDDLDTCFSCCIANSRRNLTKQADCSWLFFSVLRTYP